MLSLRAMTEADFPRVEGWLRQPHVARWWTPDMTAEAEISVYRRVTADNPKTRMLLVLEEDAQIGWCQWYRWADYPTEALAMGAGDGEVGIDYARRCPA